VNGNEGLACARRTGVDCACDQLFASSALTINKNRAPRGGYSPNSGFQLLNRRALPDDVVQRIAACGVSFEGEVLPLQRQRFQGSIDRELQLIHQPGTFVDIVKRATLN